MFKYLFCFLIIFFIQDLEPVCSQTNGDSVESLEINPDSSYKPVSDSGYALSDTVRQVSRKQLDSYLRNPDYAYANDPGYWIKEAPQKPGLFLRLLFSAPVRWIIFLGLIALVLFGIYRLAMENNFSWLGRRRKPPASDMPGSQAVEETDYDAAIRRFHEEGNYRMAVRYMYLRLIHTAREKSGIQFRDSSTNAEIARAFGSHPMAGEFRFLSTAYDYIFYGGFLPKQELYDSLKNKFEIFQQSLTV